MEYFYQLRVKGLLKLFEDHSKSSANDKLNLIETFSNWKNMYVHSYANSTGGRQTKSCSTWQCRKLECDWYQLYIWIGRLYQNSCRYRSCLEAHVHVLMLKKSVVQWQATILWFQSFFFLIQKKVSIFICILRTYFRETVNLLWLAKIVNQLVCMWHYLIS